MMGLPKSLLPCAHDALSSLRLVQSVLDCKGDGIEDAAFAYQQLSGKTTTTCLHQVGCVGLVMSCMRH